MWGCPSVCPSPWPTGGRAVITSQSSKKQKQACRNVQHTHKDEHQGTQAWVTVKSLWKPQSSEPHKRKSKHICLTTKHYWERSNASGINKVWVRAGGQIIRTLHIVPGKMLGIYPKSQGMTRYDRDLTSCPENKWRGNPHHSPEEEKMVVTGKHTGKMER